MLFGFDQIGQTLIVLITEADTKILDRSQTLFVDERHLRGNRFVRFVLGKVKDNQTALDMLYATGRVIPGAAPVDAKDLPGWSKLAKDLSPVPIP